MIDGEGRLPGWRAKRNPGRPRFRKATRISPPLNRASERGRAFASRQKSFDERRFVAIGKRAYSCVLLGPWCAASCGLFEPWCAASSFMSPAALWAAPFALSSWPSARSFSSPAILPAVSLTAPLAFSAAPLMCSRSIVFSTLTSVPYMLGGERRRISPVPDATRLTGMASSSQRGMAEEATSTPCKPTSKIRLSGGRHRFEADVEIIVVEGRAIEFRRPRVGIHHTMTVSRPRPGLVKGAGVFDRECDFERIAAVYQPEVLDHVQLVGMRRAVGIDECPVIEADRIDHKGVALIMADRFAVPGRFRICRMWHVEPDVAGSPGEEQYDFLGRLDDMHEAGVEMEGRNAGLPASRFARLAVAAPEHEFVLAAERFTDPGQQVLSRRVIEVRHPIGRLDPHLSRHLVVGVGMVGTIGHRTEAGRRIGKVIEQTRDRVIGLFRRHEPGPGNTGGRKIEVRRRPGFRRLRREGREKRGRAAESAQHDRAGERVSHARQITCHRQLLMSNRNASSRESWPGLSRLDPAIYVLLAELRQRKTWMPRQARA